MKAFYQVFAIGLFAVGLLSTSSTALGQVARVPPKKAYNSTQLYYNSAIYLESMHRQFPYVPDYSRQIWSELLDTNTISYIARANGLTAKDLSTVVVAPLHTNELALYQTGKPDKAFNLLETQLQDYVHERMAGHSRTFLLTALADHWQPAKVTDPDLRVIMANQPWLAVSWLKKERSGTYTNADQVMRWAAYTLADGPVAWTCICEFKPSGQLDSFRAERIDPSELDPKSKTLIESVDAEIKAQMLQKGTYGKLGSIQTYWTLKKIQLKAKGIDWHSPAELNPGTSYD